MSARTRIRLEAVCRSEECERLATRLHAQLATPGYSTAASALEVADLVQFGEGLAAHRTFRKRAARAERRGYWVDRIHRPTFADDVFEINMSADERQGRPMTDAYRQPVRFGHDPERTCARHAFIPYGVLTRRDTGDAFDTRLVAYAWVYRCGDLVMFSSILGHAAHLDDEIMYLLVRDVLRAELEHGGPLVAFYNRHDSGTDGLRFFKERCGFKPTDLTWELS